MQRVLAMNTTSILGSLRTLSKTDRKAAIAELLGEELRDSRGDPVAIVNRSNDTLGYFIPFDASLQKPSQPSTEELADLHRLSGMISDAVPIDRAIASIR